MVQHKPIPPRGGGEGGEVCVGTLYQTVKTPEHTAYLVLNLLSLSLEVTKSEIEQ